MLTTDTASIEEKQFIYLENVKSPLAWTSHRASGL